MFIFVCLFACLGFDIGGGVGFSFGLVFATCPGGLASLARVQSMPFPLFPAVIYPRNEAPFRVAEYVSARVVCVCVCSLKKQIDGCIWGFFADTKERGFVF